MQRSNVLFGVIWNTLAELIGFSRVRVLIKANVKKEVAQSACKAGQEIRNWNTRTEGSVRKAVSCQLYLRGVSLGRKLPSFGHSCYPAEDVVTVDRTGVPTGIIAPWSRLVLPKA